MQKPASHFVELTKGKREIPRRKAEKLVSYQKIEAPSCKGLFVLGIERKVSGRVGVYSKKKK
jgi:hypothetical protein